jgi:hypothetical protein
VSRAAPAIFPKRAKVDIFPLRFLGAEGERARRRARVSTLQDFG